MKIDESVEVISTHVDDRIRRAYKVMMAFGAFESPTATPQLLSMFLGKENQRWEVDFALRVLEEHELVERVPATEDTAQFYRIDFETHRHTKTEIAESEHDHAVDACLRFVEAYQERVRSHFALLRAELNNIAGAVHRALVLGRYKDVRRFADLLYTHTDHSNSEGFLHRQGHPELAVSILGYAFESAEREGLIPEQSMYMSNIGSAYADLGQLKLAMKHYQEALNLADSIGHIRLQAVHLCRMGIAYRQDGYIQEAFEYLQKGLALAQQAEDRHWEGIALSNLGSVYREKRDYNTAIECYEHALAIALEQHDRRAEGVRRRRLGITYRHLRLYNQAIEYLHHALQISRIEEDKREESITLSNLGITHRVIADYDSALLYLNEALNITRQMADRRGEGVIVGNLGATYLQLKNYPQAQTLLQQALRIRREVDDRLGEGYDLFNLGQVAVALHDLLKAEEYYLAARALFDLLGTTYMKQEIDNHLTALKTLSLP